MAEHLRTAPPKHREPRGRGLHRDPVTWLALGLAVALALAWTTRAATDASGHPSTPAAEKGLRASTSAAVGDPAPARTTDRTPSRTAGRADPGAVLPTTTTAATAPAPTTPTTSTSTTTSTTTTLASRPTPPTHAAGPAARPTAAAPAQRAIELSGELAFPDDVGTVYPLAAGRGVVSAHGSWSGGPLVLTLTCGAGVSTESGAVGATAAVRSEVANCSLGLSEPPAARAAVRYTLVVDVPDAANQ